MESKNVAYLERLDHIRFFAAALVLIFHTYLAVYQNPRVTPDPFRIPLIEQGHTGVPLFMVISGMILTIIVAGKEISVLNFYKNRVLRIYPLFAFMVTLGYFATPDPRPTSQGIDYLLALLPISNLYRLQYGAFGGHLWSIAVELQFYILFPLIISLRVRYGAKYLLGSIAALVLLRAGVFRATGSVHGLAFFSIFGNLDIFLVGMLVGELYLACREKTYWWNNAAAVVSLLFVINAALYIAFRPSSFFHVDYHHRSPTGISNSALWIIWPTLQAVAWGAFVLMYLGGRGRVPMSAFLSRCGKCSYSMYVWHLFIIHLLPSRLVENMTPYTTGIFVVLPVTLAISAVSYHLIEEPFFSLRARYVESRKPTIVADALRAAA